MSDITNDLKAALALLEADTSIINQVINGDDTTEVPVNEGSIKSFKKALKDMEDEYGASNVISEVTSLVNEAKATKDATLAALDNFDDRYLGEKDSPPGTDNDGNPLIAGALYFDSVAEEFRVWTGSKWSPAYVSIEDLFISNNHIKDSTITLVKFAKGTPGKYIGYDSSGNPVELDGGAGGGLFKGNNGTAGSSAGDIFRENTSTLTSDTTITENASATGPISIGSGVTLDVNGTLVIL